MSYQNNDHNPNYPESDDAGYRGKRFRDGDYPEPDYEGYRQDNFVVTEEPRSQCRQQPVQNNGYRQGYDNRQPYPQNNGYGQGYNNRQPYPQNNGYGQGFNSRQPYPQNNGYRQNYGGAPRNQYPPRNDGYGDSYDAQSGYGRRPQRGYDDRYQQNNYRNNNRNNRGRKPKKRTSTAIIVVRVIAVIMLLVGGYIIGAKLWNYYMDSKGHSNLQALSQDFDQLYAMNNDFFGWLKIEDTVIDYPVMYSPDEPERYLHMDFDGNYSESGELFMDADCDPYGYHYLIYGHHMFNGSMFGNLPKYEDEDYFNEHRTLRFDTRSEMGEYEIFAVFYSQIYDESEDVFKYYNCANLNDEGTYNYYVQNVKALSIYETGVTPQYAEKIVTLSTCNYHTDDGRFIVAARKIQ